MKDALLAMLKSKKFIAACIGVLAIVLHTVLVKALGIDIPEEKLVEVLGVLSAYILGQGLSDLGAGKAAKTITVGGGFGASPDELAKDISARLPKPKK